MILIIHYYNSIMQDDLIMSIDNIVVDFSISRPERRDQLITLLETIERHRNATIVSWTGKKPGTFRQQYSIRFKNDTSFWIGIGLIGNGTLPDRVRLEFNPNKVGSNPHFQSIHGFISRNSRSPISKIKRFDLAIDIPVDRSLCFLVKDRRMYIERRHGAEFTQYLGSRSSTVGRVKLYNKQIEANLDAPLTRLELTLDPSHAYDSINFPTVYRLKSKQLHTDGLKLTETERFILNALLQGYGTLDGLGRKTRAKITKIMYNYVEKIKILPESYSEILHQLRSYY